MSNLSVLSNQTLEMIGRLSFHASLVLVVVLVLQFALGKRLSARWRYALWAIVVARLLIPWNYGIPVVTETVYMSSEPYEAADASTFASMSPLISESIPNFELEPVAPVASSPFPEVMIDEAIPTLVEEQTVETDSAFQWPGVWTIVFAIWLLGAILIPGSIFFRHHSMIRRAMASSNNPPTWVLDILDDARNEIDMTVCPTIRMTDEVHAPTLLGAICPKILLPKQLVEESTPEEMRLFLLHELTHLKTGDILFSWVWCIALSLHWFNPLLWWAGTRIRRDRELACDEAVLRRIGSEAKDDYAHALLKAMEHVSGMDGQRYRFGLAAIAENKSEMRLRVESILAPIVRSKRLRFLSAISLTAILCASFIQFVPISRTVEAQDAASAFEGSELMREVEAAMKRVKAQDASGNVWKDKADLARVYLDIKERNSGLTEDDLKKMLTDLAAYAKAHEDDENYGWRVWHLSSIIAQDTSDEEFLAEAPPTYRGVRALFLHTDENIRIGDDPPSVAYLIEAILLYPRTKYAVPSKHSKFQHLVNERGMRAWDLQGYDAAEKYLLETWKEDRRFLFFYDGPWQQRMAKENISSERLDQLRAQLSTKVLPPLKKIEFLLTPKDLTYAGNRVGSDAELTAELKKVVFAPYDHFIALGISTEDISLKQFRESQRRLMRLVKEWRFDYFSDIGLQRPVLTPAQSNRAEEARLRASCANNLKQLGLAMKIFSNESKGERFPTPIGLTMNTGELFPVYLDDPNVLLCPACDHSLPNDLSDSEKPQWHFEHSSYWYLGYAVYNEKSAQNYIGVYRKVMGKEGDGNLDIDLKSSATSTTSFDMVFRLREGIERFFITDINDPAAGGISQSTIPLLVERPDNHVPRGGNVLFMDGHVEYIKYPGKFPMTEAFIQGLESLDALKEKHAARTNEPESSVDAVRPLGSVIFKGNYRHSSRGRAYSESSELALYRFGDGAITAVSKLPFSNTTYTAVGNKDHFITGYEFSTPKIDDKPGYRQVVNIEDGKVSRSQRGIREDEDDRVITVPSGAFYDPNSRPDPYAAANILFRSLNLKKGESKEIDVFDDDNAGNEYAAYRIRIEHFGKEEITVPAGRFNANHFQLNQLTSGDTWFKKRAGHLTDFWILDNDVIVRIYRHREPYEVVLQSYDSPMTLPGRKSAAATSQDDSFQQTSELIAKMFQDGNPDMRLVQAIAKEMKDQKEYRSIPFLIGVIDADNTYDTVYGVGYFALGRMTDVKYDEKHDGDWWREWWKQNKAKYSAEIQALPIPELRQPVAKKQDDPQSSYADSEENMRYNLIGADNAPPASGYRLLVVLPGGDGGPDFSPFVNRIHENALSKKYLIAQLIAKEWSSDQFVKLVWPTKTHPWPGMKFSTEEFIESVIRDVQGAHKIDATHIYTLSWSSGGPAVYAASLQKETAVQGSFIAMSVFKLRQLPPLEKADNKAYYLLHSPDDFIPMDMPNNAQGSLTKNGASVKLQTYQGGHGWHGDVYGMIRNGVQWLEQNTVDVRSGVEKNTVEQIATNH